MKTTKITELPVVPENYGIKYEPGFRDTDMTVEERRFISGLIRYYEPRNILEIGVAGGGGSANILNTIQTMNDTVLTSIDVTDVFQHPFIGPVEVGKYAREEFPNCPKEKWNLLVGKDPAERMDELNKQFDFVILDTAHVHPIESFNFLSILPYLNDRCVVILHDITIYMDVLRRSGNIDCFATRLLMSAICADKLLPDFTSYHGFANIIAFQVTADTRKYIRNIFDLLMLPWECPSWECLPPSLGPVAKLIDQHYPVELRKIFFKSVDLNLKVYFKTRKRIPDFLGSRLREDDPLFYGAGENMKRVLSLFSSSDTFNFRIWDERAEAIKQIRGHTITKPDFTSYGQTGQKVIVTIENPVIFQDVRKKLETLGYLVFQGLSSYFAYILTH